MARITAPVPGLNGLGVGGLEFVDSVAETDNEAIIAYCRETGYTVEDGDVPAAEDPAANDPDGENPPAPIEVPEEGIFDWINAAENEDQKADRVVAAYQKALAVDDGLFVSNIVAEFGGYLPPPADTHDPGGQA